MEGPGRSGDPFVPSMPRSVVSREVRECFPNPQEQDRPQQNVEKS